MTRTIHPGVLAFCSDTVRIRGSVSDVDRARPSAARDVIPAGESPC